MGFQENLISDNWKDSFPFENEIPVFAVNNAKIQIFAAKNVLDNKTKIEFFDSNNNLVIVIEVSGFSINIQPNNLEVLDEFIEDDFSQITQPMNLIKDFSAADLSHADPPCFCRFDFYGEEDDEFDASLVIFTSSFELKFVTE